MRHAFLQTYDPINTRYVAPETSPPPADFAFQGHSVAINTIQDWANALASHPNFAKAWVLKLCQWANTIACDNNQETVLALATDFENASFDMTHLIKSFTSPLVTETSYREWSLVPGAQVSIARKGHYCRALYVRLAEVRQAQGREMNNRLDVCNQSGDIEILSASLPEDSTARGSINLHQPKDSSPMISAALEGMCALSADKVVSERTNNSAFDPSNPSLALDLMTEHLLGIPEGTDRYMQQRQTFQKLYDIQTLPTACEDPAELQTSLASPDPNCGLALNSIDALRNIWIMICQSPSSQEWIMTYFNRRAFMNLSARSFLGLSMRSAITGLPLTFLMKGEARANELNARIAILSSSSSGEPLNVCGPGTFESGQESFF